MASIDDWGMWASTYGRKESLTSLGPKPNFKGQNEQLDLSLKTTYPLPKPLRKNIFRAMYLILVSIGLQSCTH